ncbi:heme biosynthesis HemY N-terminal domain-containing protein [Pseudomonadota bacterium]
MKWLLLALATLVGSVAVALVALPDPGYVLLGYGKYSVETSLLVFVVVIGLVFLGLRALASVWRVPVRVQRWGRRRRALRLQQWFDSGTLELIEGRFERAERRFARLLKSNQAPLQAYLSAAQAAGSLGADERRDAYLQLAQQRLPQAEVSILINQAELQLADGQSDQAQTTLTRLRALAPHSNQTLRLLMQLWLQQQNWQKLRELLPELRRSQVIDHQQWHRLAIQVYRERIAEFASATDIEGLNAGWKQLPPPVQQDAGLLAVYVEQLVRLGSHSQAAELVRNQLALSWDERLVYLYGDVQESDSAAQQSVAEKWLAQHADDGVLLLTLGKISLRMQLWGKARSYLEASINARPDAESYRLLAGLLEQLDEPEQAAECYRQGLKLLGEMSPGTALMIGGSEKDKVVPISRSA